MPACSDSTAFIPREPSARTSSSTRTPRAHRPARRGRSGRRGARDRSRPRLAHARARRDRGRGDRDRDRPRLVPLLRELVEPLGVSVVEADAMASTGASCSASGAPASGRSSPTCPTTSRRRSSCELLEDVPAIDRMLVMVQREVGERLAASPGSSNYGAVSVRVAYFATATLVGRVPPEVFHPRPNVESCSSRSCGASRRRSTRRSELRPRSTCCSAPASAARRKMLRRSLAGLVDAPRSSRPPGSTDVRGPKSSTSLTWGKLAHGDGRSRCWHTPS